MKIRNENTIKSTWSSNACATCSVSRYRTLYFYSTVREISGYLLYTSSWISQFPRSFQKRFEFFLFLRIFTDQISQLSRRYILKTVFRKRLFAEQIVYQIPIKIPRVRSHFFLPPPTAEHVQENRVVIFEDEYYIKQ